jgi:hypothetical protein
MSLCCGPAMDHPSHGATHWGGWSPGCDNPVGRADRAAMRSAHGCARSSMPHARTGCGAEVPPAQALLRSTPGCDTMRNGAGGGGTIVWLDARRPAGPHPSFFRGKKLKK